MSRHIEFSTGEFALLHQVLKELPNLRWELAPVHLQGVDPRGGPPSRPQCEESVQRVRGVSSRVHDFTALPADR